MFLLYKSNREKLSEKTYSAMARFESGLIAAIVCMDHIRIGVVIYIHQSNNINQLSFNSSDTRNTSS